jgi:hypothetical protein
VRPLICNHEAPSRAQGSKQKVQQDGAGKGSPSVHDGGPDGQAEEGHKSDGARRECSLVGADDPTIRGWPISGGIFQRL